MRRGHLESSAKRC